MNSKQDASLLIVISSNAQRQLRIDVVLDGSPSLSKSEFEHNTLVLLVKRIL